MAERSLIKGRRRLSEILIDKEAKEASEQEMQRRYSKLNTSVTIELDASVRQSRNSFENLFLNNPFLEMTDTSWFSGRSVELETRRGPVCFQATKA